MSQPGPCVICGDTNYNLSCGGPSICPKCDCGHFDASTVEKQAKVIATLRARIADLERVLVALPMYSDNWGWAGRNIDILKTVPDMRFNTSLEIKIGWLVVDEDSVCHETGKREADQVQK